jgi:hypothetical protein
MSDTPWPEEGCTLAEAFERTADPALFAEWKAGREYVDPWGFDRLELMQPYLQLGWSQEREELEYRVMLAERAEEAYAKLIQPYCDILRNGELVADGRPGDPFAERKSLEPDVWRHFEPLIETGDKSIARGPNGHFIYDVRVYLPAAIASHTTIKAQTACEAWLTEQMRASPKHRPMTRRQFLDAALETFPGLSKRSFERAWGNAIKKTQSDWGKAGRPEKSPQ